MNIAFTEDFAITGRADNAAWQRADVVTLTRVGGSAALATTVGMLWSARGLYGSARCAATRLFLPETRDLAELYRQDVMEFFLQPDPAVPAYLEYELCPNNAELPLMVLNRGNGFYGWLPFQYEGERRSLHRAWTSAGSAADGTPCDEWRVEWMLPWSLWEGAIARPVQSGDEWRGNFFRIEHGDDVSRYAWSAACGEDFHRPEHFGCLRFM